MSRVAPITSPAARQPELPSSGVRTAISFLLFVHLFLLGGAVLGNLNIRSPLMAKLVSTPGIRQYLSILNLNTAFQFALTDEGDHQVLIALDVPQNSKPAASDSEAEPRMTPAQLNAYKKVELMPQPVSPGIRKRRYLKLGQLLAQGSDETVSFLAVALANGLLNEIQINPPATPQNQGEKQEHHLICFDQVLIPLLPSGSDPAELRVTAFDRTVYPAGKSWGVTQPVNRSEASGAAGGAARRPAMRPQGPVKPATIPANQGT